MKVLFDSNVWVSAFVFGGTCKELLEKMMVSSKHEIVLTSYISNEIDNIMHKKWPNIADKVMSKFSTMNYKIIVSKDSNYLFNIRDKKDVQILDDCINNKIDLLVTGDKDFKGVEVKSFKILTPKEAIEEIGCYYD